MQQHASADVPSIKSFAKDALHDIFHFDTKLFGTLHSLVFSPGLLTLKYFANQSQTYVKPLALFIFVNFLFFVLKTEGIFQYHLSAYLHSSYFKHFIEAHFSLAPAAFEVLQAKFNTAMKFEQKGFFILLVPLFAVFLQLMYAKRYFIEHLIFSLHLFAFLLLYLLYMPIILKCIYLLFWLIRINLPQTELVEVGLILPFIFCWVLFALKTYYRQSWMFTIVKSMVSIIFLFALIILVYRTVLFFLVIHAIE